MLAFAHRACFPVLVCAASLLSAQTVIHSAPIDLSHGKPFVMVTINGKGPFRFVIDTGTGGEAFISSQLAHDLDLPVSGQARLSDPSGQGGQRAPMVLINSLNVAGVEFSGVHAVVHPLNGDDGDCQGLLGFVLFRDYLLTLDFPNRRMILQTGAHSHYSGPSVIPFRAPDGVPIVAMRICSVYIDDQSDSGGSGLTLPAQVAARLKFAALPTAFSNGQSLSTRFQIKAARLAGDVQLAGYTFAKPFVEIHPAFPLANFGSCPMQSFALTFDQKSGLVRFEARQKSLHLAVTPTPLRLQKAPEPRPVDLTLIPVG